MMVVVSLFLTGGVITSCKKYEHGPGISFRSKKARLVNKWKIEEIKDSSGDKRTLKEEESNLVVDIKDDGTLSATTSVTLLGQETELTADGTWEFTEKKEKLNVKFDFKFNGQSIQKTDDTYTILKLKNDEFWGKDDATGEEVHWATADDAAK